MSRKRLFTCSDGDGTKNREEDQYALLTSVWLFSAGLSVATPGQQIHQNTDQVDNQDGGGNQCHNAQTLQVMKRVEEKGYTHMFWNFPTCRVWNEWARKGKAYFKPSITSKTLTSLTDYCLKHYRTGSHQSINRLKSYYQQYFMAHIYLSPTWPTAASVRGWPIHFYWPATGLRSIIAQRAMKCISMFYNRE